MTATTLRRSPPGAQAGLVLLLLALAGAAWALSDQRMGGMEAAPGSELGGLGWFAVTWLTMMAAMMLAAATPMVVAYSRRPASVGTVSAFVAGYLASWLAAGLLGYGVVEGVRSLELGFLAWDEAGHYLVAAVILAAALYQLSLPKDACLCRCREPRRFLAEHWRPGAGSARCVWGWSTASSASAAAPALKGARQPGRGARETLAEGYRDPGGTTPAS